MPRKKSNRTKKTARKAEIDFIITEEVWRSAGNGKIFCLSNGKTEDETELRKRGAGTWMKVTQPK